MSNQNKRLTIFRTFSSQIYIDTDRGKINNIYVCPICFKKFDETDCRDGKLTLEHVPPSSLKGKPLVLTCTDCNNKSGSSLDVCLLNECKLADGSFFRSNRTCKMSLGEVSANVNANICDKNVSIHVAPNQNSPAVNESFNSAFQTFKGNWNNSSFNLKIPIGHFDPRMSKIALLKSAYLFAFYKLGYRYILKNCLNLVRKQLLNIDQEIIDQTFIFPNPILNKVPLEADKLYQVTINNYMHCIIVILKLSTDLSDRNVIVALPCDDDKESLYTYLSQHKESSLYNLHIEEICW